MLSSNEIQLKIVFQNNEEEKIKFLTKIINDQASTQDDKIKSLQLRVRMYFERKRWQEVINDINILEQTIDSIELQLMKIKANVQECCRKARLSIMDMMNNGKHNDETEALFFNISQICTDNFIEGQAVTKGRRPTVISNKQQKRCI